MIVVPRTASTHFIATGSCVSREGNHTMFTQNSVRKGRTTARAFHAGSEKWECAWEWAVVVAISLGCPQHITRFPIVLDHVSLVLRQFPSEEKLRPRMSTSATVHSRKAPSWRSLSLASWIALLLLVFPLATASVALVHTSINIPHQDDYQAIANFVRIYAERSGVLHKLGWILISQHNEYKLILLHFVVALQYEVTGHTNYRVLQLLGDLA